MIIIVHGLSGSGKTLAGEYLKTLGIKELVSHTTRTKRQGEIEGQSYYFVDFQTFDTIDKIEESIYSGEHYGVSRKEVAEKYKTSWVFAVTDKNGVEAFVKIFPREVVVIKIQATPREMRRRMAKRGESKATIRKRMKIVLDNQRSKDRFRSNFIIYNNDSIKTFYRKIDFVLLKAKKTRIGNKLESYLR